MTKKTEEAAPKLKGNLGPKQFRPWLVKILKDGGMQAGPIVQMAEEVFAPQMNEADLAAVFSADGNRKQFTHSWQRRLYDARKAMIEAGLMYGYKHFPTRKGNWWQLTPKGLSPEHSEGY